MTHTYESKNGDPDGCPDTVLGPCEAVCARCGRDMHDELQRLRAANAQLAHDLVMSVRAKGGYSRMLRAMARRVWDQRRCVENSHRLYSVEFYRRGRAEHAVMRAREVLGWGDFHAVRAARYILGGPR